MPLALFIEIIGITFGLIVVAVGVTVGSNGLLSVGSLMIGLVGGYRLWLALSQRRRYFSFCDVHVTAVLLAYFGGAAVTLWLSFGGVLTYWNAPDSALFLVATVYSLLFYLCARLCGAFERRFWRKVWDAEQPREHWGILLIVALIGLGAAQILMLVSGGITYMGTGFIEGQMVPYAPAAVVALSLPVPGIIGWAMGRPELRRARFLLFTCLALIPLQVLYSLTFGRRSVLFATITFLVMFLWARGHGFKLRRVAITAVVLFPFLYVTWLFFHALRIDSYADIQIEGEMFKAYESRNIFDRIGTTTRALTRHWSELERNQAEMVIDRVFIIGFLVDLIGGTKVSSPYYGTQLFYSVVVAVPRFVLLDKHLLLDNMKADEENIDLRFGLPPLDRADSILTESYINFLWFGPFLYAPLLLLSGIALAGIARIGNSSFFQTTVVSYALITAIGVETSYVSTTLNVLRTLIVLAVPFLVLQWLRPRAESAPFVPRQAGAR